MAYISLYRKYRPQTFDDVVGQDIIVKILKNSILNNKISHAYIFSGPRGTGKTSVAKIFSKAVNCLNNSGDVCLKCDVCNMNTDDIIDIVEIDAASNNGIDEIREIRNTIKLLPASLKYKVYIIDEVHMLSTSAFNALLKTLEEPPSHAIFILATTEINKIPATVLSRCQKFEFKKISNKSIFNRLKYICDNEKIKLDDDLIEFIAELSDGGLRDAINLLDQVNSINKDSITRTDVLNLIGSVDDNIIFSLLDSIISSDIKNILNKIKEIYNNSKNLTNLVLHLIEIIKDIIIYNNTDNYFDKEYEDKLSNYKQIDITLLFDACEQLFYLLNELKKSDNQIIISEIVFIRVSLLFNKNNNLEKHEIDNNSVESNSIVKEEIVIDENEKNILVNNALSGANKELKNKFLEKFDSINEYITVKEYNSVANLIKKGVPEVISDKNIIFTFDNSFEVVLFDKNVELVVKLLKQIYNKKYSVVAITTEYWKKVKEEYINNIKKGIKYEYIEIKKNNLKRKNATKLENSIENIFGEDYKIEE